MGLPLAHEIARLVTAFQLGDRLDIQHPVTLSLYFDNLFMLHTFLPLTLEPENFNTLQDAGFHHEFCPNPHQLRAPIPIHPHSYHPHLRMVAKSYHSTIHRLASFCRDFNMHY